MTTTPPQPGTWLEIRKLATDALQDNLDFLRRTLPGTALTPRGQQPQYDDKGKFVCNASKSGVKWTEQQYFLVQAGLNPRTLSNRFVLDLYRFSGQRLSFTVPPSTREFLRTIGNSLVQVFYIDDLDVQLKTQLLKVLRKVESGPLVPPLWDTHGSVSLSPRNAPGVNLNKMQRSAYSAMTAGGAFFIWGPPGTGKTKVISAAVESAIRHERSVLIASHTHIAVDNVLQKLMDKGYPVGTLVRVPPSDRTRIADDVREHGELLTDQAAAILIHQQDRLQLLQEREAILEQDVSSTRTRVTNLNADLSGSDEASLQSARNVLRARDRLSLKAQAMGEIRQTIQIISQEYGSARTQLDAEVKHRQTLPNGESLAIDEAHASRRQSELRDQIGQLNNQLESLSRNRDSVHGQLAEAQVILERTGTLAGLFGVKNNRSRQVDELKGQLHGIDLQLATLDQERRNKEGALATVSQQLSNTQRYLGQVNESSRRSNQARERVRLLAERLQQADATSSSLSRELEGLSTLAAGAIDAEALVQRYQELGLETKFAERDAENQKLQRLLDERIELDNKRKQIADDLRVKQDELLRTAPVIACTLSSLSAQPQLIQRNFDVVIVDEVANAGAAQIVYAASKATRTVALVGDFLQNAPIADSDDPIGPAGAVSVAWQKKEIFALAGIVNKETAEEHAHCVPLARQYRYPSIIADVVNAFCYDDLLESERQSTSLDGPTITFVDTSDMRSYELIQDGSSWYNDGGIELMVAIAKAYSTNPGSRSTAIGFVTPYAAQKVRAQRRAVAEGLSVQCGTSHTFQGKEVPILVFDMMQDRVDRWVGVADVEGSERQIAAAKLLNVAITRMQERLFIIGDWKYVSASEQPGMRALKALESKANFRLVSGNDLLAGEVDISM